jgi:NTE family protein
MRPDKVRRRQFAVLPAFGYLAFGMSDPENPSSPRSERIGLALGGGAARGLAHIGVLRALRSHPRWLPSIAAGTSAGSIIAALYAADVAQERIESAAGEFHWFRHVIRPTHALRAAGERYRGGLVSNAMLAETVNSLIGHRGFDELEVDLAVVAADLEHHRRVIFTSRRVAGRIRRRVLERFLPGPADDRPGCETLIVSDYPDVGRAVQASCAVPGFFRPVRIQGMRLWDGGVVDQVPVDVVRAMGACFAFGVSLSLSFLPRRVESALAAMRAMVGVLGVHQLRRSLDLADVGFQIPGIDRRSLIDTGQRDLIDIGEREMNARLLELERRPRIRLLAPRRPPAQRESQEVSTGTS